MGNSTDFPPIHAYCQETELTFDGVYHFGNVIFACAFVVPKKFKLDLLALRALMTAGSVFIVSWSLHSVCAIDIFLYNLSFLAINLTYLVYLLWRHFPVFIPEQQRELFKKLFKPLNFRKKDFRLMARESILETYKVDTTKPFAIEHETNADTNSLRILISGKLAVRCDDIFLHFIHPFEFVNSVEWQSRNLESPDHKYQVTIDVVYDAQMLVIPRHSLEKTFAESPSAKFLMDCLVSKDITRKLYVMNENVYSASTSIHQKGAGHHPSLRDFQRTNSADAINTGCRGFVRSKDWIENSILKDANEGEQLMVLNYELDVPPSMTYLPHNVPVHKIDRSTMAEAQFIAQQRKYWPAGIL